MSQFDTLDELFKFSVILDLTSVHAMSCYLAETIHTILAVTIKLILRIHSQLFVHRPF